ncbi:MAG: hypothetical protein WCX71_00975 [Candidatus Buchananbacteria bacterium]
MKTAMCLGLILFSVILVGCLVPQEVPEVTPAGFEEPIWLENQGIGCVSVALDPRHSKLGMAYSERANQVGDGQWMLMYAELDSSGNWQIQAIGDVSSYTDCSLEFLADGSPLVVYYRDQIGMTSSSLYSASLGDDGVWQIERLFNTLCSRDSLAIDPTTNTACVFGNSTGDYNLYWALYDSSVGSWNFDLLSWADACAESAQFNRLTSSFCCAFTTLSWTNHPAVLCYFDGQGIEDIKTEEHAYSWIPSLAISPTTGYPHISYGSEYIYYDGAQWVITEVIKGAAFTSICLDPLTEEPKIAYAKDFSYIVGDRLNLAVCQAGEWTINTFGKIKCEAVSMVLTPTGKAIMVCSGRDVLCVEMEEGAWPLAPLPGEGEEDG